MPGMFLAGGISQRTRPFRNRARAENRLEWNNIHQELLHSLADRRNDKKKMRISVRGKSTSY